MGDELLAELAITKPEMTKNISTPTQTNDVKGAACVKDVAFANIWPTTEFVDAQS
jgi:hypothetical protein